MRLTRRELLGAPLALAGAAHAQQPAARKVLRLAYSSEETNFDPARISDLYSRAVTSQIFEPLYTYDHLARPPVVVPLLAEAMPEVSPDFRVWTIRIRRGIYFQDDPAFKGRRRELTAEDVLYPLKRLVDPANKSAGATVVLEEGIVGLAEARQAALDGRRPFDYDAPIAGLQALDRYTARITLAAPRPRLLTALLADGSVGGAQAREVVQHYGDDVIAHPVGTGPFLLKSWSRSSRIVLERNPTFREMHYDAKPAPDDAEGQAILARLKGRRLPMVDEVNISIISEAQPLWLAFVNAEIDGLVDTTGSVPPTFASVAAPDNHLAPNLARRGVRLARSLQPDVTFIYFNMDDPVVGGMAPEKVALRRAFSLAYDVRREIHLVRHGRAIPAQSPIVPFTSGYDPAFKSEMGDHDPGRANALLDVYGYLDRDGDGWRELPDGRPLVIRMATEPDLTQRQYNELVRTGCRRIGVRVEFVQQQWPENLKQAQAGKLQAWSLGVSAADPDGLTALQFYYGPQAGDQNFARFRHEPMDRLYERMKTLPDGPERNALLLQAKRIAIAYMPYRYLVHRVAQDLSHPWLVGFRRPVFWQNWYHMVDIEPHAT